MFVLTSPGSQSIVRVVVARGGEREEPKALRPSLDIPGKLPYVQTMKSTLPTETTARLEARLPASVYATLKRAAELKGRTLSDFVVSAAHDAARRAIEEESVIRLSAQDQRRFAEALIRPAPPNAALQRAMRLYQDQVEAR